MVVFKPMSHGSVQTLYAAMLWTYYGDENDKRRSPKFHVRRTTSPHLTKVRHDTFCTMPILFCLVMLGEFIAFLGMLLLLNSRQLQSFLLGLRGHFDEVPFSHVANAGISHFHNNLDAVAIASCHGRTTSIFFLTKK